MVAFDRKGLILDVNKAMIQATGKRHEELIGTFFEDYFTDPKHAHEVVRKVFKAGSVWDYELVMKGQDETDTIVLYNASVLSDMPNLIKESQVEIKISDTGIGIPEENLSKIFDPFFTTKEVGKGTGLSMNVAYNIIKKHKGIIDVESTVGKGTTFTIRIPISQVEN